MIHFYYSPISAPCRAVRMTAKHLSIRLNLINVDLTKGENMTPDFLKMNPTHTVPLIDDRGHYIWESRAIMIYLVNKYAPDNALYPKDTKMRSRVDNMLYFDVTKIYTAMSQYFYPQIFCGLSADPLKEDAYKDALEHLERFLYKSTYTTGDTMTLADLSIFAEITLTELVDYDYSSYPNIQNWLKRMKLELPYHDDVTVKPLKEFKTYLLTNNH